MAERNKKKLAERLAQGDDKLDSWESVDYEEVDGFITSEGRFVDRWQAMELAYIAGQVPYERAKKKDYTGEYIDTAEFQAQVPHSRHTTNDGNGWNMMFSEDIY